MARDCTDRARGTDARNEIPGGPGAPQRRIGGGDAVDREYEVCLARPSASFRLSLT